MVFLMSHSACQFSYFALYAFLAGVVYRLHIAMAERRLPHWNLPRQPRHSSVVYQTATRTTRGWTRANPECPDSRETPVQPTSPTADVRRSR